MKVKILPSMNWLRFITRIGENSKLFICGDSMQSDINGKAALMKCVKFFTARIAKIKGFIFLRLQKTILNEAKY